MSSVPRPVPLLGDPSRRESSISTTMETFSTCAILRAVTSVEVELQRGLLAFQLSATQESSNWENEDECSLASEEEKLPCFAENLRKGLGALEDAWQREKAQTGRSYFDIPAIVSVSSEDSLSSEDWSSVASTKDELKVVSSSTEATCLLSLLGQSSVIGRMSLALASDMLASENLDSRQSPILLPWLRNQIENNVSPTNDVGWLLRAPLLLGSVASSPCGDNNSLLPLAIPEMYNILQPEEIQEIEEEEFDERDGNDLLL